MTEEVKVKSEEETIGLFQKALTALFRFIKFTVIDTITRLVVLAVAAAKAGFDWVVSIKEK